jgi:hypothetical protein
VRGYASTANFAAQLRTCSLKRKSYSRRAALTEPKRICGTRATDRRVQDHPQGKRS